MHCLDGLEALPSLIGFTTCKDKTHCVDKLDACASTCYLFAHVCGGPTGWVMSDWTATKSTVAAANAGLDQEMPAGLFFGGALKRAIRRGAVDEAVLDDKVTRIVGTIAAAGLLNTTSTAARDANVTSDEHRALARELSARSHVLLHNDGGVLPLGAATTRLVVVGDAAQLAPISGGAGSGQVVPARLVTPFEGIASRAQPAGVAVSYFASDDVAAAAAATAEDGSVAIAFVGTTSSEGADRETLALGAADTAMIDALVAALAGAAAERVVVVASTPGALLTNPWAGAVGAALVNFMPGEQVGHAVAAVLFGDVSPSGRLPVTFPNVDNEVLHRPNA